MVEKQEHWGRFRREIENLGDGMLLFCTGAGISKASGIPTFRGSDYEAVWKRNPIELGTFAYFEESPVGHWQWFLTRFDKYFDCQPNPAHYALAALETWQKKRGGELKIITQNVDLLHERAGTKDLIHIHGNMGFVRCSSYGCEKGAPYGKIPSEQADFEAFRASPLEENLPRCPSCGSLLRAHALLFDEYYSSHVDYQMRDALDAIEKARAMVFVGTSFAVGITATMLQSARKNQIPIFSLNPEADAGDFLEAGLINLQVKAEEALPHLCEELGIEIPQVASAL